MQIENAIIEARAFVFDLLSLSFAYPTEELCQSLVDGSYAEELAERVVQLPQGDRFSGVVQQLAVFQDNTQVRDYHELASQYISLFEHNKEARPLHPNAHLYNDGEPQPVPVYQRLKAIYRDFDIELTSDSGTEQPDHLTVQLEFMAYLHRLLLDDNEPRNLQKIKSAIGDFCQELQWVRVWVAQMETRPAHAFYQPLAQCLLLMLDETCGKKQ